MNHRIEQSEACSHSCGQHEFGHECADDHGVQVRIEPKKSEHAPEGVVSKIVGFMDIAGVFASTICTVHCLLIPIAIALLPVLAKPIMEHDFVHIGLAGFVLIFCLMAYVPGYLNHRDRRLIFFGSVGLTLVFFATFVARQWGEVAEASIITAGNTIIIFGHLLNRKLLAHMKCKHH